MAFLTIDATPVLVQADDAGYAPVKVGSIRRAFDGTLRSSLRDQHYETRGWRTLPLTPAESAAFFAYDDGGLHVISGDAFGGASFNALVTIDDVKMIQDGTAFRVIHAFTLRVT